MVMNHLMGILLDFQKYEMERGNISNSNHIFSSAVIKWE